MFKGFVFVPDHDDGQCIKRKAGDFVAGQCSKVVRRDTYCKGKDDGENKAELDSGVFADGNPGFSQANTQQDSYCNIQK